MNTDKHWEKFGRTSPYFGVISDDKFLAPTEELREAFFKSGREHVAKVLAEARYLAPSFHPERIIDFGCGVGRLVLPFSKECSQVLGIDVSPSMLREAERNASGLSNASFVLSDDSLSAVTGQADFIHSFIVFNHIPVKRGMKIVDGLLSRLAPGGIAALHFPIARHVSGLRKAASWVRKNVPGAHQAMNLMQGKRPTAPMMQMNCYSSNQLLTLFRKHGIERVHITYDEPDSYLCAMFTAQRRR